MNETSRLDPGGSRTLRFDWAYSRLMHVLSVDGEEWATPLELFFDLVFAITQVTGSSQPMRPGKDCCAGRFCLPRECPIRSRM